MLLRPGLLADAEVTVEHIEDTLYIPYQAVFEEGTQTIVYVLEGSRLLPRRVQLGRRSESQVSVREGLEEGDMVSPLSSRLRAGGRSGERRAVVRALVPGRRNRARELTDAAS